MAASENLAIGSGLPMPRVWVLEDSARTQFATGRDPKHAHVVATRGLLDKLEPIELEGVLAHEMSHIGNYDIRVMTVATILVGLIARSSATCSCAELHGRRKPPWQQDKGGGGLGLIIIVIALVGAILAPIIAQAIKFRRQPPARVSGRCQRRPALPQSNALARALEKIALEP